MLTIMAWAALSGQAVTESPTILVTRTSPLKVDRRLLEKRDATDEEVRAAGFFRIRTTHGTLLICEMVHPFRLLDDLARDFGQIPQGMIREGSLVGKINSLGPTLSSSIQAQMGHRLSNDIAKRRAEAADITVALQPSITFKTEIEGKRIQLTVVTGDLTERLPRMRAADSEAKAGFEVRLPPFVANLADSGKFIVLTGRGGTDLSGRHDIADFVRGLILTSQDRYQVALNALVDRMVLTDEMYFNRIPVTPETGLGHTNGVLRNRFVRFIDTWGRLPHLRDGQLVQAVRNAKVLSVKPELALVYWPAGPADYASYHTATLAIPFPP